VACDGLTKNISSSGVLFTAGGSTDLNGAIEYIITLNHTDGETVSLRCMGRVVRADPIRSAAASGSEPPVYQVAATLERYEFVRAQ
jgi:hypothetical protein